VKRTVDVAAGERLDRGDPAIDGEPRRDGLDVAGGTYQSRSG